MILRALCLKASFLCGIAASAHAQSDFRNEVDLRVQSWQPTKAERRIDVIAWAADIRTALRLGRESNRPIFVFTHDGRLRMKHNFYPGREDQNRVEAALLGYLEFDHASGQVHTLRLATRDATYSRYSFGAALRSLPSATGNDRP